MGNRKLAVGGIIIDGLNIKKDLFYYRIPPSLLNEAKVGCRVKVPFGEKNEPHSGFLFSIKNMELSGATELKEVEDIISESIFNEKTRDLMLFVAEKYFIPLHILINKMLKSVVSETYRRYIICNNPAELKESSEKFSKNKRNIAEIIYERKNLPVAIVRKKFGSMAERYLKEFEEKGFIERKNITEKPFKNYYSLNVERNKLNKLLDTIQDKKIKNAAIQIAARLINSKNPIREIELKKGIKQGKNAIATLKEKGLIKNATLAKEEKKKISAASYYLIDKMPILERSKKIIEILRDTKGKTLIIFPEIALIEKVKELYKEAFKDKIFIWNGINKRKLIEAIYFQDKKIILSTFFSLFLEIPELQTIVIEDASSRYFRKSSFVPFDVEIAAIKKAEIEKLKLIFSTSVPDESIFMLATENKIKNTISWQVENKVKLIDMRKEFKKHNYKMFSLYLQKRVKEILQRNGNVAVILNRKSYSTFIMCRECGYVLRCPNCKVSLYYDKEKNLLVCPICGYTEKPPNVCPRCKSPSIRYFSGGIQKLEEQIRKEFKDIKIEKLVSGNGSKKIVHSSGFSSTLFIGTEFLQSHLTPENIDLFVFISIDIFLNHYSFDASFNTFRVLSNAITEMNGKEVVIQTYIPEHFALSSALRLDAKQFFKEELFLREQIGYPPFRNLIVFSFSGKEKDEVLKYAVNFTNKIKEVSKNNNDIILGPSPAPIEKRGIFYYFEVSIKTEKIRSEIRKTFLKFANGTTKVKISVSSFLSIKEYLGTSK